ncbi:matrix metallopeptidase-21 isoform X1 [Hypomesus transpacificus]|uniref:matrix metallopeptidase-21 isoform X1 n=1 Tax=Hypomesus transpacificus TaxID=137520 RepID=UPI001F07F9A7|nr:matrix metallopeptidase-21 isoform X1 [Hypomesus transpacificus]
MLTFIQLITCLILTCIHCMDAEKLFHSRDHSDVEIPASHQAELITDDDTAERFLFRYGFIKPVNWGEIQLEEESSEDFAGSDLPSVIKEGGSQLLEGGNEDVESPSFALALREFQRVSGLSVTGIFDDATKTAMNKPRCGVPDMEKEPDDPPEANPTTLWSGSLPTTATGDANIHTADGMISNQTEAGVISDAFNSSKIDYFGGDTTFSDVFNDTNMLTLNVTDTDNTSTVGPNINTTAIDMNGHMENGSVSTPLVPHPSRALSRRKRQLATLLYKRRQRREVRGTGYMAFSKTVLKWRLIGEGYSSQLSIEDQRHIFRLAFRMWSEVSFLEFMEDTGSPLEYIDIKLGFGTGRHLGCNQKFDGSGREFAHAWFLGDIHFDDDEHFTAPNAGSGISLLKVAVHEIGHVLGLPHIYRSGSIMQPSYLPQESGFEIDWMDRKAMQYLYGGCSGRFNTVFDWIRKERTSYGEVVIRFNTYFMRDSWYWLYENRNNRTRYGDPVAVQVGWHGIPMDGVDAYVHVWSKTTDAVYFFKGTQFWKYDTDNDQAFIEDPEGYHYPRLISAGFPGVPSPIDTAFYDRRDSHIYFFNGIYVYTFDVKANRLALGFPRKISNVFPAVVPGNHPGGNIDAAYFSYTHNAIFLLKGTYYWRVVSSRDRWRRPSLPHNGLLPCKAVDQHWFDICNVHHTALKLSR